MTLTQEEIQFNRRLAVERLRLNPAAHRQITGNLTDKTDGYCAVGELGEAFHCSPKIYDTSVVYKAVEEKLDLTSSSVIFRMNDFGRTLAEIADKLAKLWDIE
jgi:hypothetical protein